MTNLREAPYSLKDGDVVAVVDKMEDELGQADLTRADDEVTATYYSGVFACFVPFFVVLCEQGLFV